MLNSVHTIKIGGEAGFGVMAAGLSVSKLASRSGYYTFDYTEYPSLIRGGHNVIQTSISDKPVYSQYQKADLLVALNQETLDLHLPEMKPGGVVLYDSDYVSNVSVLNATKDIVKIPIPLLSMVKEINGSLIMRNTVSLGAIACLVGADLGILKNVIEDSFEDKKESVIEINFKACDLGYSFIKEKFLEYVKNLIPPIKTEEKKFVLTGNEAIALGAIASGMGFAAIYPMTPTSNILHTLAPNQEKYGYVYKQPEDEIAAINMALGAAFCGARAMVATSGGGFCLMAEGYGLAGITEIPVVIIEGMRGAPATGLPTWTEQGDLRFVLHAHQGDFPRIVLAPGDVKECYEMTFEAFNLAEKYQTPVVVLVDKYVLESHLSISDPNSDHLQVDRGKILLEKEEDFLRYAPSADGISVRSFPGVGNKFLANSDEHDAQGYSTEEAALRVQQMEKRMQKLVTCENNSMESPQVFGPKSADLTLVSWGSNKGPILEALNFLPNVNYIHISWLNPFPAKQLQQLLKDSKKLLHLECNFSGQMHGLIKEKTGIHIENTLFKFDGRPFYPEEIISKAKELL